MSYPYDNKYTDEELVFIENFIKENCNNCNASDIFKIIRWCKDKNIQHKFIEKYKGKFVKICIDEDTEDTFIGKVDEIRVDFPYFSIETKYYIFVKEFKALFESRKFATQFSFEIEKSNIVEISIEEFEDILINNINKKY